MEDSFGKHLVFEHAKDTTHFSSLFHRGGFNAAMHAVRCRLFLFTDRLFLFENFF